MFPIRPQAAFLQRLTFVVGSSLVADPEPVEGRANLALCQWHSGQALELDSADPPPTFLPVCVEGAEPRLAGVQLPKQPKSPTRVAGSLCDSDFFSGIRNHDLVPFGGKATYINELRGTVGFLDVFSGTLRRGC